MSNLQSSFTDTMKKIYYTKKDFTRQYLDKYGGSVVITFVVFGICAYVIGGHYIKSHLHRFREEWINNRCNPLLMPFAGLIQYPHKPPWSPKSLEFTSKNFSKCLYKDTQQVVSDMTAPHMYASKQFLNNADTANNALNQGRKVFNNIRTSFETMTKNIMNRILNFLVPVLSIFERVKDLLARTAGVATNSLLFLFAVYDTTKAAIGATVELMILAIIILVALIVLMWILPWTWPMALIMTAIFVFVAVLLAIIAYWFNKIYKMSFSSVPTSTCFDGETKIQTTEGEKSIKDICLGDILQDGARVTSIFKVTSALEDIYSYHGVLVSGTHKVLVDNNYKEVSELAESVKIEYTKPYLYCLNTTSKEIHINGIIFCDWDEIDERDWRKICIKAKEYLPKYPKKYDIHAFLEGGFEGETPIALKGGKTISIKNVCVNDKLKDGGKVLGVVEIDAKNISGLKKIVSGKKSIICGPNIHLIHNNLGNISTLKVPPTSNIQVDKLYHLVTDTKFVNIQGTKFYDYNAAIEILLEGSYLLFANV